MQWWRVLYRLPLGVVITAMWAAVPALVRLLSFGSVRYWGLASIHSCRVWGRGMTAILGVRVRCHGPIPNTPVFVVTSNHLSYLDILVLGRTYPTLFVAKRSISTWPLFGWIARGAGTLFVDRDSAWVDVVDHLTWLSQGKEFLWLSERDGWGCRRCRR